MAALSALRTLDCQITLYDEGMASLLKLLRGPTRAPRSGSAAQATRQDCQG
ncbi:hypothetical protein PSM7751_04097 [Pseudooceanicola marinus]|uniref:Uncharacterized protein n=1 Tax=Pseudooceanicola marinus TaxID=396013 RepID=A0A1X7A9W9_9RHOB|nr:hypothetical protein PSM7751_04097 [Pseudooceanicola marinus]